MIGEDLNTVDADALTRIGNRPVAQSRERTDPIQFQPIVAICSIKYRTMRAMLDAA